MCGLVCWIENQGAYLNKKENLLLITGAGASYDSIDEENAAIAGQIEYRPPLTKQLFTPYVVKDSFSPFPMKKHYVVDCLKANRKAYQVGYGIDLTKNINPGEGIENELYKLKNSEKITDQKLYWMVPLYLNELFNEVSKNYLPGGTAPSNYYQLLLEVNRSKYKKLVWINLNYDLLADYAIGEFQGKMLADFDQHMDIKYDGLTIKYTKPHGSVNWYYRYKDDFNLSTKQIKDGDISNNFEEHLGELCYDMNGKYRNNPGFYPAITAPIAKYEFIQKKHYEEIKKDLKEIDSILCIGFSGLDKDILALIKRDMGEIAKMKIVGTSSAENVLTRIKNHCQNVICGYEKNHFCKHGFTKFCQGDLQKWLQL